MDLAKIKVAHLSYTYMFVHCLVEYTKESKPTDNHCQKHKTAFSQNDWTKMYSDPSTVVYKIYR